LKDEIIVSFPFGPQGAVTQNPVDRQEAISMNPFEGVDIKNAEIEELVDRLTPLFRGLQIRAPIVDKDSKFFRARIVKSRISNISEVGMPPASLITKLGRLNGIGEQVGYFSTSHRSAYFEVKPKTGDFIILSRWISESNLTFLHIGYQSDLFSTMASSRTGEEFDWALGTRQSNEQNRQVYDFLSSELTKTVEHENEGEYKTTIAIARKFLGDGPHDGLIYPSIAMKANADNVALKKVSVSKLRLYAIEFNRVKERNGMQINYDRIDSSVNWDKTGNINWNGRCLIWEVGPGQIAHAKAEDGCWNLYDTVGKEIFPI
jgi:hypothetical protein